MKSQVIKLYPRHTELHVCKGSLEEIREYQSSVGIALEDQMIDGKGVCQPIPFESGELPKIMVSVVDSSKWDVMHHELMHACKMYAGIFGLETSQESDEWNVSLSTFLMRALNWEAMGYPKELDDITLDYY